MNPTISYETELNPQQCDAVFSTEGPHLVIAGAGSGKTRVLVYRTAYLVEKGVEPSRILLLTFTRRAAQEMLARASELLDDRCQKVSGGTFHSFAHMMLRRYGEHIGLPKDFTILDQSDSENVVHLLCSQMGLKGMDKRFPKKAALQGIISKSVNKCTDVYAVIEDEYPHFLQWAQTIQSLKDEYNRYKRSMGLLDYDDLLLSLRNLLLTREEIRRSACRRYQYIMVDEYQDTNQVQAEIVQCLASEHKNVMAVGDDSQSIYSFRGARFKNIIDFPAVFPGTKMITLEQNYRSSQPILNLTNEVIRMAQERFEKNLFTTNKGKQLPVYVDTTTENGQSKYIVNKILDLRREGVPLNQIAVLFRSGWHSNDLEVELAGQGISFVKYGGQKFVEAAHIKDALSYLRVASNPYDEISWLRILTLTHGVGQKTAAQVVNHVIRERKGFAVDENFLKSKEGLVRLFDLMRKVDVRRQRPAEVLDIFLNFYLPVLMDQYDDYDKRINDLESLQKIIARYHSLDEFLSDMALEPPEKSIVDAGEEDQRRSRLVLSTIHSAKGLEWHTVFLIFLAEGYLPSYRSFDNEEAIEEERRLFYVATTRAKQNLFLIRPQMDSSPKNSLAATGSIYTRASRFIEESQIFLRKLVHVETFYGSTRFACSPLVERGESP